MATCAVQSILDEASCFYGLDPNKAEVAELQLLCNIVNKLDSGGAVTCDIDALLEDGRCFYDLSPQVRRAVKLQLLCEILNLI